MQRKLKDYIINTILLIVPAVSLATNYLMYQRGEDLYEQGYQEGSVHIAELLKEMSNLTPAQKQEIAVIWWTDTKDMLSARKALCGKPQPTQTKKE